MLAEPAEHHGEEHTTYSCSRRGSRIFLQGGGVNDGRVLRAPSAPAPTGGLGLINIRLRYIASIEYSERFIFDFFFFC